MTGTDCSLLLFTRNMKIFVEEVQRKGELKREKINIKDLHERSKSKQNLILV